MNKFFKLFEFQLMKMIFSQRFYDTTYDEGNKIP